MRKTIITSLALAAAALAATPSLAAEARLSWKDLDLTTAAGQAELDSRIEATANQVCTADALTGTRIARGATSSCLAEARTVIKAQIASATNRANGTSLAQAR